MPLGCARHVRRSPLPKQSLRATTLHHPLTAAAAGAGRQCHWPQARAHSRTPRAQFKRFLCCCVRRADGTGPYTWVQGEEGGPATPSSGYSVKTQYGYEGEVYTMEYRWAHLHFAFALRGTIPKTCARYGYEGEVHTMVYRWAHFGFAFHICISGPPSETCKSPLEALRRCQRSHCTSNCPHRPRPGRLPAGVSCASCTLQWWWTTSNSCSVPGQPFGSDMMPCDTPQPGPYPEEVRYYITPVPATPCPALHLCKRV